jgi:hypothetical protein
VIVDVPPETPVTVPDDEPMVATLVVPLVHVPPGEMSVSVVDVPAQIEARPVIAPGSGFTVTVFVR